MTKLEQRQHVIILILAGLLLGIIIAIAITDVTKKHEIVSVSENETETNGKVAGIYNFTDHREVENWLWQLQDEGYKAILWAHPVDLEEVNVTYCDKDGSIKTYYTRIPSKNMNLVKKRLGEGLLNPSSLRKDYMLSSDDAGYFYLYNEKEVNTLLWFGKYDYDMRITVRNDDGGINTYMTDIPEWDWEEVQSIILRS